MHLFLHVLAEVGILRVLLLRIYFYCDNMSYQADNILCPAEVDPCNH